MLARKYKLKRDKDFKELFKKGEYYQEGIISLNLLANNLEISRFAFVIGLKVSKKAVQRNRLKRQMEEIIRLNLDKIKPGFDIVIRVKPEAKDFQGIQENLISLLKKAKIIN